jgi:MFS family permease
MTAIDEPAPAKRRFRASYYLFLLFLANLLNIADRALLGIVVDPVKADLRLSDTEMSLVSGSAFVLFNLAVGLFIAHWVDRGNRKLILALGVSLWSGATALTGVAQGFYSLATTRVLVGVGEATAFPVAISMIADLFAAERRPRAISIFQSSTFVGLVLGSILAGRLAAAYGWRAMFLMCGLAGFLLVVLLIVTLYEPDRNRGAVAQRVTPTLTALQSVARLMRISGFTALSLGTAFATMAVSVLPVWAPAFLLRSHNVDLAAVGALIGPAVGLGGIAGTVVSGAIASSLVRKRGSEVYGLLVPMVAVPLAAPFFVVFTFAPSLTVTMAAAAVMNFLLAMTLGPCIAVAIGIAPPTMRAVSSTCVLLVSGIVGGALAPVIVGGVSDWLQSSAGSNSLRYGLATMAPTPLIAGLLLWFAYSHIRDESAALERLGRTDPHPRAVKISTRLEAHAAFLAGDRGYDAPEDHTDDR